MLRLRRITPAYYVKKTGFKGILPFVIATLFSIFMLPSLKIDTIPYLKPPTGDPYFRKIESMKKTFSPAVFIMLSGETKNPFGMAEVKKLANLTDRLSGLTGVGSLVSITSIEDILEDSQTLRFIPLSEGEITEKEILKIEDRIRSTPLFSKFLLSPDEKAWSILVFPEEQENSVELSGRILQILEEDAFQGIQAFGYPILSYYAKYSTLRDFFLLTFLSLLVVLIVEILICRSIITGLMLWFSSILPALWTVALFAVFGQEMRVVGILIPILTLALSTSYSIHLYRYYCSHPSLNLTESLNSVSPIIGTTGGTTILGFAMLVFSPVGELRISGIFIIAGICLSMISALYMLPVLLGLRPIDRSTSEKYKRAYAIEKVPKTPIQIVLLAILVFTAIGILRIHADFRIEKMFQPSHPIVKATEYFNNKFGGIEEIQIILDTHQEYGLIDLDTYNGIKRICNDIYSLAQVNLVISHIDFVEWANGRFAGHKDPLPPRSQEEIGEMMEILYGSKATISLSALTDISYSKARLLIRFGYDDWSSQSYGSTLKILKQQIDTSFNAHLPGVTFEIAGPPIEQQRVVNRLIRNSLLGILIIFPVLYILLSLLFRSLKLALLPLLPVLGGVIVYFGLMGWMGFPFNALFTLTVAATIGVGVDDAIYFLLFFRQQCRENSSSDNALAVTVRKTGKAIIQTTLIIDLGLLVLLFSTYRAVTESGLLIILSLSFSTLSTLFLVPSLLRWAARDRKFASGATKKTL